jgi:hypothetical protein
VLRIGGRFSRVKNCCGVGTGGADGKPAREQGILS